MKAISVSARKGIGIALLGATVAFGASTVLQNGVNSYKGMQDKCFYTTDGNGDFNAWGQGILPEFEPVSGEKQCILHGG